MKIKGQSQEPERRNFWLIERGQGRREWVQGWFLSFWLGWKYSSTVELQAFTTWVCSIAIVWVGGVLVTLKIILYKQLPIPNIYFKDGSVLIYIYWHREVFSGARTGVSVASGFSKCSEDHRVFPRILPAIGSFHLNDDLSPAPCLLYYQVSPLCNLFSLWIPFFPL